MILPSPGATLKPHRKRLSGRRSRKGKSKSRRGPVDPKNSQPTPRLKKSTPAHLPRSDDPDTEKNVYEYTAMPQGYCFVSKGDVYITRQCRAKSKESRRMVYKVYDKKGQRVLGIRVPEDIWQKVLVLSKETKEARAAATISRDSKFLDQGRELLEKQYPLMPGEDIESVLQHAFCKGSGRVGRTATHSDGHKARLAVEAHIRHEHTPYDHLLKDNDRLSARRQVRNTVQTILKVWKGEKPETQESLVGRETRGAASLCDNTVEPRALEIS